MNPRYPVMAFQDGLAATGHGEVWTHPDTEDKFRQFGWRCTKWENSQSSSTLLGNWFENNSDIEHIRKIRPLPSSNANYYVTTYGNQFNKTEHKVPGVLKLLKARYPHSYPSHQPELDHPSLQACCNSWATTSRAAFVDPELYTRHFRPGHAPCLTRYDGSTVLVSKPEKIVAKF